MDLYENFIETRSILYNIEPKGIGTINVESLTSYLGRLGMAHNVITVRLIRFLLNNEVFNISVESQTLNGNYKKAERLTQNLNIYTGRRDLNLLSLIDFPFLLSKYILRLNKAWCPTCLLMDELKGCEMYERLLWQFRYITFCPIHNCRLETICSVCNKEMSVLSSNKIGHCNWCNAKLSLSYPVHFTKPNEKEIQGFIIKEISLLLQLNINDRKVIRNAELSKIMKSIYKIVEQQFEFKLVDFAAYLGVSSNMLTSWKKDYSPNLLNLLRLSFVLNVHIADILKNDINADNIQYFPKVYSESRPFNKNDNLRPNIIRRRINKFLKTSQYETKTLKELAAKVGISQATFKKRYPKEYMELSLGRLRYLIEKRKKKKVNLENEIRKEIHKLISSGKDPSFYRICKKLSLIIFEPEEKEMYYKVYDRVYQDIVTKS